MTPREQLRKMTALGEQGALDEKHWYRLVNGMSAGGENFGEINLQKMSLEFTPSKVFELFYSGAVNRLRHL